MCSPHFQKSFRKVGEEIKAEEAQQQTGEYGCPWTGNRFEGHGKSQRGTALFKAREHRRTKGRVTRICRSSPNEEQIRGGRGVGLGGESKA